MEAGTAQTPSPSQSGGSDGDAGETIPLKRGRGRPPGSKTKPKTEDSPGIASPVVEIDASLVADCFVGLLDVGDEWIVKSIVRLARRKVPEEHWQAFAGEVAAARLGNKDKEQISKCVVVIVKKYGILQRFGPEVILLLSIGVYGYRMNSLMKMVNKLPDLKPITPAKTDERSGTDK